jgi:hypothetical protein
MLEHFCRNILLNIMKCKRPYLTMVPGYGAGLAKDTLNLNTDASNATTFP